MAKENYLHIIDKKEVDTEFPVILNRYGKKELSYFNFVYHSLKDNSGSISGIIVVATYVTESVIAKHALAMGRGRYAGFPTAASQDFNSIFLINAGHDYFSSFLILIPMIIQKIQVRVVKDAMARGNQIARMEQTK